MVLDLFYEPPKRKNIGKKVKELLYKDQSGKCMYCGRKLGIAYLQVDHKTPVARKGSDRVTNLQLLCSPCNTRKGDMTNGEFRKKYGLTPASKAKKPQAKVIPQTYFQKVTKESQAKRAKRRQTADAGWPW